MDTCDLGRFYLHQHFLSLRCHRRASPFVPVIKKQLLLGPSGHKKLTKHNTQRTNSTLGHGREGGHARVSES